LGFGLTMALLGSALFIMALLMASAPGWWLGALPFLALYAAKSDRSVTSWAAFCFSSVLAIQVVAHSSGANLPYVASFISDYRALLDPISLTLVFSLGLVLAVSMFYRALLDNDPYRLSVRPIVIGIAGDSGSGKDVLSDALARLLGEESTVIVSGDDYHKWERDSQRWEDHTHLSPRANRLDTLLEDVRKLVSGKSISCRLYDHSTGRFIPGLSKRHNDIVVVSGLHVLQIAELRDIFDVKIFLDMDEPLRRYFKVVRDTRERGRSVSEVLSAIDRRVDDGQTYIKPQSEFADLIFRLKPVNPENATEYQRENHVPLEIDAVVREGVRCDELARLLVSLCGASPALQRPDARGTATINVSGDGVSGEDIKALTEILIPDHQEVTGLEPVYERGVTGFMQLVILMQIRSTRLKRA